MDRPIARKTWTPLRTLLALALAAGVVFVAYQLIARSGSTRLTVDVDRINISQISEGAFKEYVPITGQVKPVTSVFLDLEEGGIVEMIYIESGNAINKGDLVLSLSNTALQKQNIDSEARILENLDRLRNSKIQLTEKNLLLKDQLLDLEYQVQEQKQVVDRYRQLVAKPNPLLQREKYETATNRLSYLRKKRALLEERIEQESILRIQQNDQIDASAIRVNKSLTVLSQIVDGLNVHAPIDGYLSSMSAEIGQSFQRGQRVGQIDQLDQFNVRADIDQYYIGKLDVGQQGTFEFGGKTFALRVEKIYTEVNDDRFQVDMAFVGERAKGIKRGQTLQIDLSLSESRSSLMVSKGGFYRNTNGRWVYRVASDGSRANRTAIVAGRQNPQAFEILDGLAIGDRIISSSYDLFNDADELTFNRSINNLLKGDAQ